MPAALNNNIEFFSQILHQFYLLYILYHFVVIKGKKNQLVLSALYWQDIA